VGIALLPRDAAGMVEKADGAMYRAKQAGKAVWSMA
jgi:GGDEF domain-containing protein